MPAGPTSPSRDGVTSPADDELGRQAVAFRDGLSDLDRCLRLRWRPDYGDLRAPATEASAPELEEARLRAAHERYRGALEFFALHTGSLGRLPQPIALGIRVALADAHERFGEPAIPLDHVQALARRRRQGGAAAAHAEVVAAATGDTAPPAAAGPSPPSNGTAAPRRTAPARRSPSPPAPAEPEEPPRSRFALVAGTGAAFVVVALLTAVLVITLGSRGGAPPVATPPPPATLPPAPSDVAAPVDVTALARACTALPSGGEPAFLRIAGATSGTANDPASGLATPFVAVQLAQTPPQSTSPYEVVVALLPYAATGPAGQTAPIDRIGTTQLYAHWDGAHWHRGMRTWNGNVWSTATDTAAGSMDLAVDGATLTFYWDGISAGTRYGEVTATSSGCGWRDVAADMTPQQTYTG